MTFHKCNRLTHALILKNAHLRHRETSINLIKLQQYPISLLGLRGKNYIQVWQTAGKQPTSLQLISTCDRQQPENRSTGFSQGNAHCSLATSGCITSNNGGQLLTNVCMLSHKIPLNTRKSNNSCENGNMPVKQQI